MIGSFALTDYVSTVRCCVAPELELNYTRYVAWRGLMPESLFAKDIAEQLNDRMSFYLRLARRTPSWLHRGRSRRYFDPRAALI